jgi:RNA polymerase sigma factor (sigma-70 family)
MKKEPHKEELLKLIRENRGIIFKICNAYCKNEDDREDLAQEIVYQLLRSYAGFTTTHKFSTWMYRVALNVAISFYRKTRTVNSVIKLGETDADIEDKTDGTPELEKNINRLQQFISELKELDRALMILYLEEKNYKEISEIIGITETNVATKISRIKDKLKQRFSTINN